MRRFAAVLIAVASVVVSACSGGEAGREWGDATGMTGPIVSNATELVAADDYRLLVGDAPGGQPGRCVQLVIGTVGLRCFEADREAGGWSSISLEIEGQRIVWFRSSGVEPVADH
ncbi:MAG: hypothetical protein WA964_20470, partial [Ilumatobacter sp.]|uniref:hypothetical protein n=1 Tax=Ilumatobacter sp. TaxID=1967498 RepID=UPI003C7354A3